MVQMFTYVTCKKLLLMHNIIYLKYGSHAPENSQPQISQLIESIPINGSTEN